MHRHPQAELDRPKARDTLEHLHALWRRPVTLQTRVEGQPMLWRYDGREHTERRGSA